MRVLFASPFAGIWVHALPEAMIARALQLRGHDVHVLGCDGLLSDRCAVMDSERTKVDASAKDRRTLCARCKNYDARRRSLVESSALSLDQYASDHDAAELQSLLGSVPAKEWPELTWRDSLPVGEISQYICVLESKRHHTDFDADTLARFEGDLRSSIKALQAGARLLDELRPEVLVLYNSLYPVCRCLALLARDRGIRVVSLHASLNLHDRLGRILMGEGTTLDLLRRLRDQAAAFLGQPLPNTAGHSVVQHAEALLNATSPFVYSARTQKSDAHHPLLQPSSRPRLLATLSSPDERHGLRLAQVSVDQSDSAFLDQADWIKHLLHWLGGRDDVELVIRVHPREFPNKREGVRSAHALALSQMLQSLPANVFVNWPDDHLPLYAVAQHARLILNAWSSVGAELALFGHDVATYTRSELWYPASIHRCATRVQAYKDLIEGCLTHDDLEADRRQRRLHALRWFAWQHEVAAVDHRSQFHWPEGRAISWRALPKQCRKVLSKISRGRTDRSRAAAPLNDSELIAQCIESGEDVAQLRFRQSTAIGDPAHEQALLNRIDQSLLKAGLGRQPHRPAPVARAAQFAAG